MLRAAGRLAWTRCRLAATTPAYGLQIHRCSVAVLSLASSSTGRSTAGGSHGSIDTPVLDRITPSWNLLPQNHLSESEQRLSAIAKSAQNPYSTASNGLRPMPERVRDVLGTTNALLESIIKHVLDRQGQRDLRPTAVALMGAAARAHFGLSSSQALSEDRISRSGPSKLRSDDTATLRSRQLRVAEIVEMIRSATLLHRDVVLSSGGNNVTGGAQRSAELLSPGHKSRAATTATQASPSGSSPLDSDTKKNKNNSNSKNKVTVLAGDFLLANASLDLAKVRSVAVTELVSEALGNIAEGEMLRSGGDVPTTPFVNHLPSTTAANAVSNSVRSFMRQLYLTDAALLANGCRAVARLACTFGGPETEAESFKLENAAFQYAFHLSMTQELVNVANTLRIFTERSETDDNPQGGGGIWGSLSNATNDCAPLISIAASVDFLNNGNSVVGLWQTAMDPQHDRTIRQAILENDCIGNLRERAFAHARQAMVEMEHFHVSAPRDSLIRLAAMTAAEER